MKNRPEVCALLHRGRTSCVSGAGAHHQAGASRGRVEGV